MSCSVLRRQVRFADATSPRVADRASGVIVAHNHPVGPLSPSEADIEATRQLKTAGEILGIAVLDHLIFNRKEHYSFLENGTAF